MLYLVFRKNDEKDELLGIYCTKSNAEHKIRQSRYTYMYDYRIEEHDIEDDQNWFEEDRRMASFSTDVKTLKRLSFSDDWETRECVAGNEHCPKDVLMELACDPDDRVRTEALSKI